MDVFIERSTMYKQREIPDSFRSNAEQIHLLSSALFKKIRSGEITDSLELFSNSRVMVRAYQKLFPVFEVCDGNISRFCETQGKPEYGDLGYFHYHRSIISIEGQLKLIPHSLLVLNESSDISLPKLAVDVLPLGHIKHWPLVLPLCLDEYSPPFFKKSLLRFEKKDLVRNVRLVLGVIKDLKKEVYS